MNECSSFHIIVCMMFVWIVLSWHLNWTLSPLALIEHILSLLSQFVILNIRLKAIKMLPNNHKIAHNIVQTTILFTFYPQEPHVYCGGTIKIQIGYMLFSQIQNINMSIFVHYYMYSVSNTFNRFHLHDKQKIVPYSTNVNKYYQYNRYWHFTIFQQEIDIIVCKNVI